MMNVNLELKYKNVVLILKKQRTGYAKCAEAFRCLKFGCKMKGI
jgi:hypothetical protein